MIHSTLTHLGEGWTPLLLAKRLGAQIGCANTYIKDD
jgi:hypothetical protein